MTESGDSDRRRLERVYKELQDEEDAMNYFYNKGKEPKTLSAFDEAFGVDPLDMLMEPFGPERHRAEQDRARIEKHGGPPKKYIPLPPEVTFEKVQQMMLDQFTETTCLEEFYFERYLLEPVKKALQYAFDEAENLDIVNNHRAFRLFCPLDLIAENLWRLNSKHPERVTLDSVRREDLPLFQKVFAECPREEPPLHLRLTVEQAVVIIQKRWRGTLTRRRPDIKAKRRQMAAFKVTRCDPFKLVEDLWNREIPPSRLKAFAESRLKEPVRPVISNVRQRLVYGERPVPPTPPYLEKMKQDFIRIMEEEERERVKQETLKAEAAAKAAEEARLQELARQAAAQAAAIQAETLVPLNAVNPVASEMGLQPPGPVPSYMNLPDGTKGEGKKRKPPNRS